MAFTVPSREMQIHDVTALDQTCLILDTTDKFPNYKYELFVEFDQSDTTLNGIFIHNAATNKFDGINAGYLQTLFETSSNVTLHKNTEWASENLPIKFRNLHLDSENAYQVRSALKDILAVQILDDALFAAAVSLDHGTSSTSEENLSLNIAATFNDDPSGTAINGVSTYSLDSIQDIRIRFPVLFTCANSYTADARNGADDPSNIPNTTSKVPIMVTMFNKVGTATDGQIYPDAADYYNANNDNHDYNNTYVQSGRTFNDDVTTFNRGRTVS